jgi:hypothetical protein
VSNFHESLQRYVNVGAQKCVQFCQYGANRVACAVKKFTVWGGLRA